MKDLLKDIKKLAAHYHSEIIDIRRQIHANPELAFEEYETAALVSKFLDSQGIDHQTKVAKTGIVGLIKGKNPGKRTIALRADMDALPILEKNKIDYKSKHDGKMHACGHDVHTASLLGAAAILQNLHEHFEGTVKLIFQPSEEKYPGGAKVMIEEGILKNPAPAAIFGQHVFPELQVGKVGMRSGKYMASTDEVFLTVKGQGGHGAIPHKNIDPVLIASHIVVAMQQLVSRHADPTMPTVLSLGRIMGEGQTNVIPDEVKLDGIIRTFDEEWRATLKQKITKLATGMAESMGGSCEVFIDEGYPYLVNDHKTTERARENAKAYLGEENVVELGLRTTAEDFAYFSQQIPGCFYRLGTRNESLGITSNLHTATFNVDEDSLITGMGLMAWLAVCDLHGQ